jgi:hypothetical protein
MHIAQTIWALGSQYLYHLHPAEHAQNILLSLKTVQDAQMKMIRSVCSFWNYLRSASSSGHSTRNMQTVPKIHNWSCDNKMENLSCVNTQSSSRQRKNTGVLTCREGVGLWGSGGTGPRFLSIKTRWSGRLVSAALPLGKGSPRNQWKQEVGGVSESVWHFKRIQ